MTGEYQMQTEDELREELRDEEELRDWVLLSVGIANTSGDNLRVLAVIIAFLYTECLRHMAMDNERAVASFNEMLNELIERLED